MPFYQSRAMLTYWSVWAQFGHSITGLCSTLHRKRRRRKAPGEHEEKGQERPKKRRVGPVSPRHVLYDIEELGFVFVPNLATCWRHHWVITCAVQVSWHIVFRIRRYDFKQGPPKWWSASLDGEGKISSGIAKNRFYLPSVFSMNPSN